MVTLLVEYVHVGLSLDVEDNLIFHQLGTPETSRTYPSNEYTNHQLKKAFFLWFSKGQNAYVWLYGANNMKYIFLSRLQRTTVTSETTHAQLYISK